MKRSYIPLSAFLLMLCSCQKENITSTWVAKETTAPPAMPAMTSMSSMPSMPGMEQDPSATNSVTWTKPSSWEVVPPSNMRVASFSFKSKTGGAADISVVRLAGDGGGLLANINRWRGQLQLAPTTEGEIQKMAERLNIDGHPMTVFHLVGKESAMMAAIYELENESWYFKATGDVKTVAEAKPSYTQFLKSVRHPH